MIYLSDEEQEIFDEGFQSVNSPSIPICSYISGTLGHDLWYKGFCSALNEMVEESKNHVIYLEFLNDGETYAFRRS